MRRFSVWMRRRFIQSKSRRRFYSNKRRGEEGLLKSECDEGGGWARPRNAGIGRRRRRRRCGSVCMISCVVRFLGWVIPFFVVCGYFWAEKKRGAGDGM
jgi:hypothetical protein